jgi:hypothetical protein
MASTQSEANLINEDRGKQEASLQRDLERMGITVSKCWPTGDNAYSPEWTLFYEDAKGRVSSVGPTLNMTVAGFVQDLLKARK